MAQQCRQISHFPDQEYNAVSYVQTHACALPKSCIYFFEGPSQWTMLLSCKNVIQTLSILFITKKFQFHSNHSKSCGDNLHPLTAKALHNSNSDRRTHGPTTNHALCVSLSLRVGCPFVGTTNYYITLPWHWFNNASILFWIFKVEEGRTLPFLIGTSSCLFVFF